MKISNLHEYLDNSSPLTIVHLLLTLQIHGNPSSDTGLGILIYMTIHVNAAIKLLIPLYA